MLCPSKVGRVLRGNKLNSFLTSKYFNPSFPTFQKMEITRRIPNPNRLMQEVEKDSSHPLGKMGLLRRKYEILTERGRAWLYSLVVKLTARVDSCGACFHDRSCILSSLSSKMQTLSWEQKTELSIFPTELSHLTTKLLNCVWPHKRWSLVSAVA